MSRAAMWGPVDAAVRCAMPLLLQKVALAKSTGSYLKNKDWTHLLDLADVLANHLPPITSRSAADHAWSKLSYSAVGGRHTRFSREEGSATVFHSVIAMRQTLALAGAGRGQSAMAMAAQAIYGARKGFLGEVGHGRAAFRLHVGGGAPADVAIAAAYWEAAIRGLCDEVANEPRLLQPGYELALADFAHLALERADQWLKVVAPDAWSRVSALR